METEHQLVDLVAQPVCRMRSILGKFIKDGLYQVRLMQGIELGRVGHPRKLTDEEIHIVRLQQAT